MIATPDILIAERFKAKCGEPNPLTGCVEWTGVRNSKGYGSFKFRGHVVVATRVAIYLATGEYPPDGMFACHKCDNPACVNADHLFLATQKGNIADCIAKGRFPQREGPLVKLGVEAVVDAVRIAGSILGASKLLGVSDQRIGKFLRSRGVETGGRGSNGFEDAPAMAAGD
jgi:hypothetical protein